MLLAQWRLDSILDALGKIEIRIPKTESLAGFGQVLEKAATVIEKSDASISMATDVAAMGVISANSSYKIYEAALRKARARPSTQLDIVWLKADDESKVMLAQHIDGSIASQALNESSVLRQTLIGTGITERTLPSLMFFYFWTGSARNGDTESVIAFNDGPKCTDPVTGFYSNSKDVHTALKRLEDALKSESVQRDVSNAYQTLTGCTVK